MQALRLFLAIKHLGDRRLSSSVESIFIMFIQMYLKMVWMSCTAPFVQSISIIIHFIYAHHTEYTFDQITCTRRLYGFIEIILPKLDDRLQHEFALSVYNHLISCQSAGYRSTPFFMSHAVLIVRTQIDARTANRCRT